MKQPHARTVGLFVVGAITLAVVGIVAFGRASSYFEHRPRAVTFFHGSVAGLAVGAPVTFRGVRVGSVVDIAVQINSGTGAANIPVIMEFEPERITVTGNTADDSFAGKMLANGLGASMVMQSLITGQLAIELDYHPKDEEAFSDINLGIPQIPEARGGLSAVKDTISKLPVQQLADDLVSTVRLLKDLLAAPEIRETLKYTAEAAKSAAHAAATADAALDGVGKDTRETAAAARRALERADLLLADLQPRVGAALAALERVLSNTDQRTGQLTGDLHTTLGEVQALVAPRSPTLQDVQTLLRNLAAASGSLRTFAEQVERNPNSILVGKNPR